MSRKPGLGHKALQDVADTLGRHKSKQTKSFSGSIPLENNLESLWHNGAPESLRLNGQIYPMGKYLAASLLQVLREEHNWNPALASTIKTPCDMDLNTNLSLSVTKTLQSEAQAKKITWRNEQGGSL